MSVLQLAIQLTAIDVGKQVLERVRKSVLSLGDAGKKVKGDFEQMERSLTTGLKAMAISAYAARKAMGGIRASADLQAAMLRVKMNLASGAKDAGDLNNQLRQVRQTATAIAANAPFSAEDVVNIQNALLKAGMSMKDVGGESGAAWAATALASLTGEAPEVIGNMLARIGSQFRLEGAQYGTLSDWIVRVDDASASSVPELIQGLKMAGSNAAALGVSAEDSVTAIGALAPLGERAGSSFNNFLLGMLKLPEAFKGGKFQGMAKGIEVLKQKFGTIKSDQQRLTALTKAFGEEGARAANIFINASKGYQEIESAARKSLSIGEKMSIWGEGLNAALQKLGGTARSTLASLFDPLLKPLRLVVDLLNTITGKIGDLAEKNRAVAGVVSGGVAAAVLGGGAYGLYHILKGGKAAGRVWKGLGGLRGTRASLSSTAAGIAEGKAIQAATGVTPVFVTNWPSGFGGGGAANLAAGGKGIVSRLLGARTAGLARLAGMGRLGALLAGGAGSAGLGATLGLVGAAAASGYGIGTVINKGIDTLFGEKGGLGSWAYDAWHAGDTTNKNNISVAIHVDKNGRTITKSDDTNTTVNLERGEFPIGA